MIMSWQQAVASCAERSEPCVLATVLATSGSTPREAATKMVITASDTHETIGGGQLEQLVIERARTLLEADHDSCEITHFPLAAAALQCCGGSMTVLLESFGVQSLRLCVFGAGHVGRRVAQLMRELDCAVTLVDTRPEQLDQAPAGVRRVHVGEPVAYLTALGSRDHVLVMTHDHQLDYQLVRHLAGQPIASLGLIGSATKWCRFRARLLADGVAVDALNAVRCPVGRSDIPGKAPMAVAIAIVAELLQMREASSLALSSTAPSSSTQPTPAPKTCGLSWRRIRGSLVRA